MEGIKLDIVVVELEALKLHGIYCIPGIEENLNAICLVHKFALHLDKMVIPPFSCP